MGYLVPAAVLEEMLWHRLGLTSASRPLLSAGPRLGTRLWQCLSGDQLTLFTCTFSKTHEYNYADLRIMAVFSPNADVGATRRSRRPPTKSHGCVHWEINASAGATWRSRGQAQDKVGHESRRVAFRGLPWNINDVAAQRKRRRRARATVRSKLRTKSKVCDFLRCACVSRSRFPYLDAWLVGWPN